MIEKDIKITAKDEENIYLLFDDFIKQMQEYGLRITTNEVKDSGSEIEWNVGVKLMGKEEIKADKVYFVHNGGEEGQEADFFVKTTLITEMAARYNIPKEQIIRVYSTDYLAGNCGYALQFVKDYPNFTHVASTDKTYAGNYGDNKHGVGWGMPFDGYTEVKCPRLEEEE